MEQIKGSRKSDNKYKTHLLILFTGRNGSDKILVTCIYEYMM